MNLLGPERKWLNFRALSDSIVVVVFWSWGADCTIFVFFELVVLSFWKFAKKFSLFAALRGR